MERVGETQDIETTGQAEVHDTMVAFPVRRAELTPMMSIVRTPFVVFRKKSIIWSFAAFF
jgi:hypothetical protein